MSRGLWGLIEQRIGGPAGRTIVTSVVAVASLVGAGLLWAEYRERHTDAVNELRTRATDATRSVDIVAGRLVDHVELLRRAIETRLVEPGTGVRTERYRQSDTPEIVPAPGAAAASIAAADEVAALLAVTPLLRTTVRRLDGAVRVRYTSASGFQSVFPKGETALPATAPDATSPVDVVSPERDPKGAARWALSEGPDRTLRITAPVYGADRFRGAISLELSASGILSEPVRDVAVGVDVVIATGDRHVLTGVDGDGDPNNDGEGAIPSFPPDLIGERADAVYQEAGNISVVAPAAAAPWVVIVRAPASAIATRALARMETPLVAVPTAITLLAFMLRLFRVNRRLIARELELRSVTADLTRARDEARAADRAKAVFLANIGHELRTPLNAVIGFAELIPALGADSKEYHALNEYAAYIKDAGDHLLNVLNDVLDLARAEADRIELRDVRVDPVELVRRCGRMVRRQAETEGVDLRHGAEPEMPALLVDEVRLRQIVINLLNNAVKFTPSGGRVETVVSRRSDGGVRIAVHDTGVGIAAADIPKALEPFGQVHNALSRTRRGAGLGLALSRRLVELHGGTLSIESEPGVGTTVNVDLPAGRVAASVAATETETQTETQTEPAD